MANKQLIAVQKMYKAQLEKVVEERTCAIYGGLCLTLHDIGVSKEGILKCMRDTEKYWNDSIENGWDILDAVREVVGINILNVVEGEDDES